MLGYLLLVSDALCYKVWLVIIRIEKNSFSRLELLPFLGSNWGANVITTLLMHWMHCAMSHVKGTKRFFVVFDLTRLAFFLMEYLDSLVWFSKEELTQLKGKNWVNIWLVILRTFFFSSAFFTCEGRSSLEWIDWSSFGGLLGDLDFRDSSVYLGRFFLTRPPI